ncbi:GAF domain-containing protein [Sphingobacteriales bacterium UPWRP_1]|nr:hypothetical protein BVG80_10855 [Sphingobacteriales bacterium TSM_CSM]PSJ77418.1 GAF domain-containing protein [Sphingobacteriales bacterium UPWRP_1]
MHTIEIDAHFSRAEKYRLLLPQIESLIADEPDLIANLANIAAVLKENMGFFWVGFYRRIGEDLVLGPFQGSLACTRIPLNKGVCGACATKGQTIIVPDVDAFPGHIACSSLSRSEITVPLANAAGITQLVLDIDSNMLNDFDETDARHLEKLMELLQPFFQTQ